LLKARAVSASRVTWATSVPILVFLSSGLSVLDLGPMYVATDAHHRLTPLNPRAGT